MKIFRKTGVAVLLTVLMIAAAVGIGRWRGARAEAVPPPLVGFGHLSVRQHLPELDQRRGGCALGGPGESDCPVQRQLGGAVRQPHRRGHGVLPVGGHRRLRRLGVEIELASADGILVVNTENGDCYLAVVGKTTP